MIDEQAFAALSRRSCPPVGEALFAVAASWRPVNWTELDAKLDHLARPLFAAGPGGRERAGALAELLLRTSARTARRSSACGSTRCSPAPRPPAAARRGGHRARPPLRLADHGLLEPGGLVRGAGRRGRAVAGRSRPARTSGSARRRPFAGTARTSSRSSSHRARRALRGLDDQARARSLRERLDVFRPSRARAAARMTRVSMSVPSSRRRIEMRSSLPCMSASSAREIGYG